MWTCRHGCAEPGGGAAPHGRGRLTRARRRLIGEREATEGRPGADRGHDSGNAREHEGGPGIDRLAEQAGDRAADRGRAEKDHRVQGHHPAAHRRFRRELERGVDPGREGDAGRPERNQGDGLEGQGGGGGGDQRDGAEAERGSDQKARSDASSRSRHQGADYGSDPHCHRERGVRGGAPVEAEPRQQRQDDLKVVAERPHQGHHRQRDREGWCPPDVTQRGTNGAGAPRSRGGGAKLVWLHGSQRDHHGAERERVDQEAGAHTERGDQDPGRRRPQDACGMNQDAVQADRVDNPIGAHHLDREALAGREVDRVDRSPREDEGVNHPRRDNAGARHRPQGKRGERHHGLGDREQGAFRKAIGEQPSPGAEEEQRQELKRRGHPDRQAAARQRQDQPHLGDDLGPVAAHRDELAHEVAAVVGDGQ